MIGHYLCRIRNVLLLLTLILVEPLIASLMRNCLMLMAYGIQGDLLCWLKNFFVNRSHQTKVGFCLSDVVAMMSGIIQGSGIGPVMFIIYIDDLAKLLEQNGITAKLFADDVKVYLEINDAGDSTCLQKALDIIANWAKVWQLSVSVSKCSILTIGQYGNVDVADYYIGKSQLSRVDVCRDLGITVTSDLSSSQHINEIVNKAHQRANHIIRCFVSGNTRVLVRAFIVYVRPILEYNSVIWSPSLRKDIDAIEKGAKAIYQAITWTQRPIICRTFTVFEYSQFGTAPVTPRFTILL